MTDPQRTNVKAVKVDRHWAELGEQFAEPGHCFNTCEGLLCFACPGCGNIGNIAIGSPKPTSSPSWDIKTGSVAELDKLSLRPSIHCRGCCGWHGWLDSGVFTTTPPRD